MTKNKLLATALLVGVTLTGCAIPVPVSQQTSAPAPAPTVTVTAPPKEESAETDSSSSALLNAFWGQATVSQRTQMCDLYDTSPNTLWAVWEQAVAKPDNQLFSGITKNELMSFLADECVSY